MFWNRKTKPEKPEKPHWVAVERESGWYVASTKGTGVADGPYGERYARHLTHRLNEQEAASRSVSGRG